MKTGYLVSCFVIRPAGEGWEFLQLKRSPGKFMGDTWQLVTGGIEDGESAVQAMLRELREEADITPVEFYQLDVVNTFFLARADTIYHSPMFAAFVPADVTVTINAEHTAYRWVPEKDIVSQVMWPGERTALAELKREILNNGPARPYLKIELPE